MILSKKCIDFELVALYFTMIQYILWTWLVLPTVLTQRQECQVLRDVVFVVDSSGSIREKNVPGEKDNWERLLEFISDVIDRLDIGLDKVQVGAVVFSTKAENRFFLNDYSTKQEVKDAIKRLPYIEGFTNTSGGLRLMRTDQFTELRGDRPDAPNVAVVITDATSNKDQNQTIPEAELAQATGVTMFTVGFTDEMKIDELKAMSSPPRLENRTYWLAADTNALAGLTTALSQAVCVQQDLDESLNQLTVLEECEGAQIDIALVIDGSGSIRDSMSRDIPGVNNWDLLKIFLQQFVDLLDVSPTLTRVGGILYSNNATLLFGLNAYTDSEGVKSAFRGMEYSGGGTNTSGGIKLMRSQLFGGSAGDRRGVANVAVVLTDGKSTIDETQTIPAADEAKEDGIRIMTVGITSSVDELELRQISSSPQARNKNYFMVPYFDQLGNIVERLAIEVCAGGSPPVTERKCDGKMDVVFVIDSSGSIGDDNFETTKLFVINTLNILDIERDKINVGFIQFSTTVSYEHIHKLNKFDSREAAVETVSRMSFIHGTTNTALAIQFAVSEIFTGRVGDGDRLNVEDLIILITDGGSDDKEATYNAVRAAKQQSVHIIAIGIGNWVDETEMKVIASYPSSSNFIPVEGFDQLGGIVHRIADTICDNINECSSNPCAAGQGECQNSINMFICRCNPGYGGRHCENYCRSSADVAFVVDASSSVGQENFQKQIDFLQQLAMGLSVASNIQLALETYSTDEKVYFYFSSFETKRNFLNAMSVPYLYGGTTNTAAAFTTARTFIFTAEYGDRPGSDDILLLLTDGWSDRPWKTWDEAMQLREQGVHVIVVGIGNMVNDGELNGLGSYPINDNVIKVQSFDELYTVQDTVQGLICNNGNECSSNPCLYGSECRDLRSGFVCECPSTLTGNRCERRCSGAADLVFVIDGSGSIRHERFQDIKDFIIGIVEELELNPKRPDKVRVAAICFDNEAFVEFFLNTYQQKQDIIQAIQRIHYLGGRTNIADAFRRIRKDIFLESRGDREQVPNFAIVFSDGASNIDETQTLPQAIAARVEGVHIITVGVGSTLSFPELQGMSSDPYTQNLFTAKSFDNLPGLVPQVVGAMCDDTNECLSNPCQFGGNCLDELGRFWCQCPADRTGEVCQRTCMRKQDIVIMMDLSGSLTNHYRTMVQFVRHVIYGLDFRFDRTRLALAGYAEEIRIRFQLNTYTTKREALNAVAFRWPEGRTNTQGALLVARDKMFRSENGDRFGVVNKLVMVTDGLSDIRPDLVEQLATDLRNRGTQIYAVAMGDEDVDRIGTLVDSSDNLLYLSQASSAEGLGDQLLDILCA